jgi:hypothetical protein
MQMQSQFVLKPKDAIVLASVLEDLQKNEPGPKMFLNRNSKDFANPNIYDALRQLQCELVTSFDGGLLRIEAGFIASANPAAPKP